MSALVDNVGTQLPLSKDEVGQVLHYEGIVARTLQGFKECGDALAAIHNRRLYREGHPKKSEGWSSFEAYVSEQWQLSRRHAYRLIEGAAIAASVTHGTQLPEPETERQARALAAVPEPERVPVWQESVERNGGKPAPSNVIQEVWNERRGEAPVADDPESVEDERAAAFLKSIRPKDPVPESSPVAPRVPPEAEEAKGSRDGDEWYTRENHAGSVWAVLGRIDLDPASCAKANVVIQAREYFGLDNGRDGLAEVWCAKKIFLNPPYSNAGAWIAKLAETYRLGLCEEAIALVNANTSSAWFENLWGQATALCWVIGRVSFTAGDGGKSATGWSPSVFAYFGDNPEMFRDEFKQYGRVQPLWLMRQWEEEGVK